MTVAAERIAELERAARELRLDRGDALAAIAGVAERRGGASQRSSDGSFFTADDVALWVTRRAVGSCALEAAGCDPARIERALADGEDPFALLAPRLGDDDVRRAVVERVGSARILDPTCGAGALLAAAWLQLVELEALVGEQFASPRQLVGIDRDPGAVAACRAVLGIVIDEQRRGDAEVLCADALELPELPAADIVVGNPPYVRARAGDAPSSAATATVPNVSAWIVERALDAARPGAHVSFVLPISTVCTSAFAPARAHWRARCDRVFTSHFDAIPASLFPGVVQRISIFEGRVRDASGGRGERWWTTRYHRWLHADRHGLLDRVRHTELPPQHVDGSLAKVGSAVECELLELLFRHDGAGRYFDPAGGGSNRLLYKRRWSYYLLFCDFVPPMWDADGNEREPSEFKAVDVVPGLDARALLAVYSSTLFWWYFSAFTDNRNVNRRDLEAFPLPQLADGDAAELAELGAELMDSLRACAEVRTCTYRSIGTIRNTYFRQGATRPVLDRIDACLARVYGMSEQQLEFVLGFERAFRKELSPAAR